MGLDDVRRELICLWIKKVPTEAILRGYLSGHVHCISTDVLNTFLVSCEFWANQRLAMFPVMNLLDLQGKNLLLGFRSRI